MTEVISAPTRHRALSPQCTYVVHTAAYFCVLDRRRQKCHLRRHEGLVTLHDGGANELNREDRLRGVGREWHLGGHARENSSTLSLAPCVAVIGVTITDVSPPLSTVSSTALTRTFALGFPALKVTVAGSSL